MHKSISTDVSVYNLNDMPVILPLLTWTAIWLIQMGRTPDEKDSKGLSHSVRASALTASIIWGAVITCITELNSLLNTLNQGALALSWAVVLAGLCFLGFRRGAFRHGWENFYGAIRNLKPVDWLLLSAFGFLSGLLLLVLLKAPPNNTDSFQYHLSRVMHWAQNGSLRPYATAFVQQLYNPIWAEETILHLRLLWGNDQLAGLVQWGAMLISISSVTLIAAELGLGRAGQWVTAAFAFSLPMGLLQATSTQNDYVVTLWLVCVAWLVLRAAAHPFRLQETICLGLALGLGLLTKGVFYPFVVPFGIWYLTAVLRWIRKQPLSGRFSLRQLFQSAGLILLSAALLNAGYWVRNLLTFDSPLGPREWISAMTAGQYGPGPFIAALIRNAVMNFATPSERINAVIVDFFRGKLVPLDSRMADFNLIWGWNHEDIAGNPLHVALIIVAVGILLFTRKRGKDGRLWAYLAAVGGVYAMLSLVVHADLFGTRYQVPLFILAAPLVGAALVHLSRGKPQAVDATRAEVRWQKALIAFSLVLLAASVPWVLINRTRPLLALKDGGERFTIPCQPILGCTVGSILFEPPTTIIFANWMDLRDLYLQMGRDLKASGCQEIGLRLDSHDPEYLYWWLLDAPQSGTRLETLYTFPELEQYIDPAFKPCAVICTICGDRTSLHGLPLSGEYDEVKVFAGPDYSPQVDP